MNIAAAPASTESPPPSTLRAPPRVDLFGHIHKAIRFALSDLLAGLGSTAFDDPAAVTTILARLEDVVSLCEDHRGHEDRLLFPELGERLRGTLDSVQGAHGCQPLQVVELRTLADALRRTTEDRRRLAGRTLYLHFSTFAAELLLHMAEEERVIQPLLERFFSDDELDEIHRRLLASLTPAEKMRSAPWLLRALDPLEREAFRSSAGL
jgi:hemerythrin-like domain-containing protein